MIHLTGDANKSVDDVFRMDDLNDWEEETNIDTWLQKNNNINYAGSGNVGIGVENPLHKLDIQGNINVRDSGIFTNDVIGNKVKASNIEITSSLLVDTINEKTSSNGVRIDNVLLKDGEITATALNSTGTTYAQSYNIGNTNVISASRQVVCSDLEVGSSKLFVYGTSGNITTEGTLSIDTINEKTSASGVTVENVLLKDGIISTDTINEKTSASGVTVENVLLKDGIISTDTINEKTSASGVTVENVLLKDGIISTDTINEKTLASGVTIENVLLKDNNITAHTISAQNYSVGGTNFISASRQGNFRDLEVKNDVNNATILLSGGTNGVSGGDISITGTLSTDTISEKTSGSGITIDSVLLKDNNITAHTISAQNYSVGGTNFISASRQGNFRDLEVKDNSNNSTILLSGGTAGVSGGDISITGTLSTDTISEKTSGTGVTIDSVLLKDNNITAHTISAQNYSVGGTNFISASRQGNFQRFRSKR